MHKISEQLPTGGTRSWTRLDLTDARRLADWLGVEIDTARLAEAAGNDERPGPPSSAVERAFRERGVLLTLQQFKILAECTGLSEHVLQGHVPVEARYYYGPGLSRLDEGTPEHESSRERDERIRARRRELNRVGEGFQPGEAPFLEGVSR